MADYDSPLISRSNGLTAAGWGVVMDSLEGCPQLSSVNGFDQYKEVLIGRVATLNLNGTELALALSPFFLRSAETLTSLDMRCARFQLRASVQNKCIEHISPARF